MYSDTHSDNIWVLLKASATWGVICHLSLHNTSTANSINNSFPTPTVLQRNPQFTFVYFQLTTLCNGTCKPVCVKSYKLRFYYTHEHYLNCKLQFIKFPLGSSEFWHHVAFEMDTSVIREYSASIFRARMILVRKQSGYTATGIRNAAIQNQGRVRKARAYISYLHRLPATSVFIMGGKNVVTSLQGYTVSQLSTPQSQHYTAFKVNL